jgi:selenocysteine lyase/cysteine desulfurase
MAIDRRQFLLSAAAVAASGQQKLSVGSAGEAFPASVRASFPIANSQTFFNGAAHHPISPRAARALEGYIRFRREGPGPDRADFSGPSLTELKGQYARLINAKPTEIAFVQSTSDGESVVVAGLDLARRGGNVVLDELHFISSLYMYKALSERGLEMRLVKHRDWAIDVKDVEKAIDKNTRLVSMALVSNVNGFMHDARAVANIAHAHGAYLYADIIQAVGSVPLDVRALGIDFAAASTYKWLMAERGFGLLYVREDLQDSVLPTTRYGYRHLRNFNHATLAFERLPGAARYETGTISAALALCASESLRYIEELGLVNIRANARALTDRLQRELPALGYRSLTPAGTDTPILAVEVKDPAAVEKKLSRANISATVSAEDRRLRLSVSVFNNQQDVERLLEALSG